MLPLQGRSHPAYGRSLTASLEPYTGYHGAASAEMPSMRMPFGKSSLLADFRGPLRRGNLPTSQAQRRPSASDAPSSSSPDGVRNSPDDADRESSLASPRRPPESFWSRMRSALQIHHDLRFQNIKRKHALSAVKYVSWLPFKYEVLQLS